MHRTGLPAAPLRAAVRWLTVALLACAAMLGGTTAAHAAPTAPPLPAPADAGHGDSHGDGHGRAPHGPATLCRAPTDGAPMPGTGDGGCGSTGHQCLPASAPPLPPVVPLPVQPTWLVWVGSPDGRGGAPASHPGHARPDLVELCVSRT